MLETLYRTRLVMFETNMSRKLFKVFVDLPEGYNSNIVSSLLELKITDRYVYSENLRTWKKIKNRFDEIENYIDVESPVIISKSDSGTIKWAFLQD